MTDQEIAEQCAQEMLLRDEASKGLGVSLQKIGPGFATATMTVTEKMLNGHKICHGGFIFALADSTFAFACNSYNQTAVAASCDISYLRQVHLNDNLTACATETSKISRNGVYDVTITNQNSEIVALFRGKSRIISKAGPLGSTSQ